MWIKSAVGWGSILFLCVPFMVFAHATPTSYIPAAGSTELQTPSSISIRFSERIEVGASSLTVFGPDGNEIQQNKGSLDPQDERALTVPITDAGWGTYTVSWQVVSVDDGHFTKGAFSFLVDATGKKFEGDAGTTEIAYSSKLPEAILSFFNLLGESVFLAVILLLLLLQKKYKKGLFGMQTEFATYTTVTTHLISVAGLLFVFAGSIAFFRKSLELASLQKISLLESLLIYSASGVGTFLLFKIGIAILFVVTFFLTRKKIFTTLSALPLWILLGLLSIVLYMQSQISHAAASFFYPQLSVFITFVHLASKEFIIGGLIILLVYAIASIVMGKQKMVSPLALHFNLAAAVALLCASLSGVYITWLHVKHFESFSSTQWGVLFCILLCVTAMLGVFRLWHQFIVAPYFSTASFLRKSFFVTLPVEIVLGLIVLFFSGYISITTPPFIVEQYVYTQSVVSEGVQVELRAHPYELDSFQIILTDTVTKEPIIPEKIIVSATNRDKNIGPNVLQTEERFSGGYVFPKADLTPNGVWEISVIAQKNKGYDTHATFAISYPDDVLATKVSDDVRLFDTFARIMIGIGVALLVLCSFFVIHAYVALQQKKQVPQFVLGTYSFKTVGVLSLSLLGIVVGIVFFAQYILTESSFKHLCIANKQQWQQAPPTRNFENTSPNSLLGCTVHEGHFHFVDEREYRAFMESL